MALVTNGGVRGVNEWAVKPASGYTGRLCTVYEACNKYNVIFKVFLRSNSFLKS